MNLRQHTGCWQSAPGLGEGREGVEGVEGSDLSGSEEAG